MKSKASIALIMISLTACLSLHAQMSGGTITMTSSVVSGGGGSASGSGIHIDSAIAQPAVGPQLAGGTITIDGGFFTQGLAPTAAAVSLAGRVLTPAGVGVRGCLVQIDDTRGLVRQALTSSLGYFRIEDVPAGAIYIITVNSKRYRFEPRILSVTDSLADLEIIASP